MKTTAERLENNQVKVTVVVSKDEVKQFINNTYKELARTYRFKGFRPGKAPRPVIDKQLGKEAVLGEATNYIIGTFEPQVIEAENIAALGDPIYDKDQASVKEDEEFTYTITFNVKPQYELDSYDPVEIELPFMEASDAEIDQQLERFQGYYATFNDSKSKRMCKKGDFVSLTIEGKDEASFLTSENRLYEIGSGAMPETFDKELIGTKPGETKEFDFAVDGDVEGDKAQTLSVKVTLNTLKDRVVPELDDDFAKNNFGLDSMAAMRESLKADIESQKAAMLPEVKETNAIQALGKRLNDEVPENYRQIVFQDLANQFLSNAQRSGFTLDQYLQQQGMSAENFIEDLNRQADDVARESLALDALARHLKLEVTDKDIEQEFVNTGVEDPKKTQEEFLKSGRMPSIRDYILRSKAIEWLVENAKVTEVDMVARLREEADKPKTPAKKAPAKKAAAKKPAAKKESAKKADKAEKAEA